MKSPGRFCEFGALSRLMNRPNLQPTGTEVPLQVVAAGAGHRNLDIWEYLEG